MQITDRLINDKSNENVKQLFVKGLGGRELFWDMATDLSSLAFEYFSAV